MQPGIVAVTGPQGRLGRALVDAFGDAGWMTKAWGRPDYDLDSPETAVRLVDRDRPGLVIHSAAWTDVDGCAREPDLANRRNGDAVAALARACQSRDVALVGISTNEVFDGARTDGRGYREDDPRGPINAYGRSKLLGEEGARSAYGDGGQLWIVRTSWLYGPPGGDFPHKILAAAHRLPAGESLRVVADEHGSPTFTPDLARAIVTLVASAPPDTYHLVNTGATSRAGWAERVLAGSAVDRPIQPIGQREFVRASTPPAWGVLDTSKARSLGVALRPWEEPFDGYLASMSAPR